MIPAILFGLALAQAAPQSGAALISKMFGLYASASSMTGTIQMIQSVQNVSVELDTTLAYEAPSKLYLKQVLNAPGGKQWLITSDGVSFTYDYPNEQRNAANGPEPSRLWESVAPGPGVTLDFRQIFRAAIRSLGDTSLPELVAIAGKPELTTIKDQIVNIGDAGVDTIDGQKVHVLAGDWRLDLHAPVTGKYRLYVTDDGQLKRFVESEMVGVSLPGAESKPQQVTTIWNVDLHPGAKPDDTLFKVVK